MTITITKTIMADEAGRIKDAKKKLATSKCHFHKIFNRFAMGVKKNEDEIVLKQMLTDMEEAHKNIEDKFALYVELMDTESGDNRRVIKDSELMMERLYDELCSARLLMRKTELKEDRERELGKTCDISPAASVKIRKLDAPMFGGEIRKYPSFMRDYKKHVVPLYGTDPYALKKCLTGDALTSVQSVCDDYKKMMERLDVKYGRPEIIIDEVLNKLKRLKPVREGDSQRLIEMVEVVESCWLELKKMDLTEELNSDTTIGHIEKLLPPSQLREWALIKYGKGLYAKKGLFTHLLEYLIKIKVAAEYTVGDLRRIVKKKSSEEGYVSDSTAEEDNHIKFDTLNSLVRIQMQQNSNMIQEVMSGVAQIVQAIGDSSGERRLSRLSSFRNWKRCCCYDTEEPCKPYCSLSQSPNKDQEGNRAKSTRVCLCCLKKGGCTETMQSAND